MHSPKDYLINKQCYRKKLSILTGSIIKSTRRKLPKCLRVWRDTKVSNMLVKEANSHTLPVTWGVTLIFKSNMTCNSNKWKNNKWWKKKIMPKKYNNNLLNNKKKPLKNLNKTLLPINKMQNQKPPKRKMKLSENQVTYWYTRWCKMMHRNTF